MPANFKIFLISVVLVFGSFAAQADCKSQLIKIISSAEALILNSDLDPRCKALGLKGGKQNCIQATEGTVWDLKALLEPILNRGRNHCKQSICSAQKQVCTRLLSNETHLVKVGIYGLLQDIENADWQ